MKWKTAEIHSRSIWTSTTTTRKYLLKKWIYEDCGTVGYCLAIKRKETVPFTERCMDLGAVTQTEVNQKESKYCIVMHMFAMIETVQMILLAKEK